jgi:MFS superfamily sulfate permease-like transporter
VPWKIPHGMAYAELVGVPATATAISGTLALVTSGLRVLFWGASRLGSIADLPLCPVQLGYLNGLPTVMVVSPVSELGGFSGSGDTPAEQTWDVAVDVADR